MSDSNSTSQTTEPGGTGGNTDTTNQQQPQGDPDALGDAGKKALQAERDARTAAEKAAADLKRRLDQIEAANMTDLDKAKKEAADAREAAEKANAEALRFRIAAKHQISADNAELILTGPDEATMERQAALWASTAAANQQAGPRPDLTQGGQADPPALNGDPLLDTLKDKLGIA